MARSKESLSANALPKIQCDAENIVSEIESNRTILLRPSVGASIYRRGVEGTIGISEWLAY